jgi:hypothetical protein
MQISWMVFEAWEVREREEERREEEGKRGGGKGKERR